MLTLVLLYSGFMFSQVETSTLSIISVCHWHVMRAYVAAALLSRGCPRHPSAGIRVRVDGPRNYMELLRRELPHDGRREHEAGAGPEGEDYLRLNFRVPGNAAVVMRVLNVYLYVRFEALIP